MLEVYLDARRGNFHLTMDCAFAAEWTVIFGPSGSGKSTLLRLIAGLGDAQRARIILGDRMLSDLPGVVNLRPGQRGISMVSQQTALFPHLNVAANVSYGVNGLQKDARESRIAAMLELVGANDLAERRPRELSGGEAQRVALARALAPMPQLLLLDEPFSALDGAASDVLLARLQKWLLENRVQTVMATHDATDALATHSEVALLREGRLAALGPAAHVLTGECERLLARIGRT